MKVTKHTSFTVEHEGREYEVQYEPEEGVEINVLSDGTAIIGYLVQDQDCQHPLNDCDGMGKVYDRRHRNSTSESRAKFYEACGRDENGAKTGRPNPLAVLLDVYEHSGTAWSVSGEGMNCQFDTSHSAGVWVPDDSCEEHIKSTAIEMLLPEGTKVEYKTTKLNPDGTVIMRPAKPGEKVYPGSEDKNETIDERFYNVITWTLPDGRTNGGYKSFESAYRAAAKTLGVKLDKAALKAGERKAAEKCARQAIEEYNKWLSGDCWGIIVGVHDKDGKLIDEYETCWGFIGSKYAEKERDDYMDSAAKKHAPKATPEEIKEAAEEFAQ